MDAYARLRGVPLEPWETEAVARLDDAYLDELAKQRAEEA